QIATASGFSDNGLAAVKIRDSGSGKWGYIDETGAFVIEPQFDSAQSFLDNGLALVEVDGKWGYIDETGAFVIEP
ncbi:MAG: WG repeat-containing protein, partial [Clostridiaceae bacterium]|nr:WG repeat-containing protein [Clostridiaceae bacterium]